MQSSFANSKQAGPIKATQPISQKHASGAADECTASDDAETTCPETTCPKPATRTANSGLPVSGKGSWLSTEFAEGIASCSLLGLFLVASPSC